MNSSKRPRRASIALMLLVLFTVWQIRVLYSIPTHVRLLPGQKHEMTVLFPLTLSDLSASLICTQDGSRVSINSDGTGTFSVQLRLLGLIPVRDVVVDVVDERRIVPGGEAIGVLLASQGLMVLRTVSLDDASGRELSPSAEAGIKPGDILVSMAGQPVRSTEQVSTLLNHLGPSDGPIPVEVRRDGKTLKVNLRPAKVGDSRTGYVYMMGAILDPPTAGVGTLTFYDNATRKFGAVGHQITNTATGAPLEVDDGRIVKAYISGIRQGVKGRPGEKQGIFHDERDVIGVITKNTSFGIYGHLLTLPGPAKREIPVALAHQVKEGPATMLTVLDGNDVEEFNVHIDKVNRQNHPNNKSLILTVTDGKLLSRTGGIVQGMSGSPILQDGRLIGAVTHVFMNDPSRGFGVLAEWMVYEAGILDQQSSIAYPQKIPAVQSFPRECRI